MPVTLSVSRTERFGGIYLPPFREFIDKFSSALRTGPTGPVPRTNRFRRARFLGWKRVEGRVASLGDETRETKRNPAEEPAVSKMRLPSIDPVRSEKSSETRGIERSRDASEPSNFSRWSLARARAVGHRSDLYPRYGSSVTVIAVENFRCARSRPADQTGTATRPRGKRAAARIAERSRTFRWNSVDASLQPRDYHSDADAEPEPDTTHRAPANIAN